MSHWKSFKDLWKGPKKAYAAMGLGQAISWGGTMMTMMGERDKAMLAEGGHEWRKLTHENSYELYREKGDGEKFFMSKYTA